MIAVSCYLRNYFMKLQLVLLAIALTCGAAFVFAQPDAVEPVWHTDWREAQRQAQKANKPIFAVMVCKH